MNEQEKHKASKNYGKSLNRHQRNMVVQKFAKAGEFYHIRRSAWLAGYEYRDAEVSALREKVDALTLENIELKSKIENINNPF